MYVLYIYIYIYIYIYKVCWILSFSQLDCLLNHLIYSSLGIVFNLLTSKSPVFVFKVFKLVGKLNNL